MLCVLVFACVGAGVLVLVRPRVLPASHAAPDTQVAGTLCCVFVLCHAREQTHSGE